jgi:hypothetical protein
MLKRKWLWLFIAVLLAALLAGGCTKTEAVPEEEQEEEVEEIVVEDHRIIVEKVKPVTVVINNHTAARPQSGLQQASNVYEFLVEGGTTRFLAVFDDYYEKDFVVGPVRSLRPYFAVQGLEHGGVVAHSGYSARTAEMIRGLGIKQVTSAAYLWRDSSRNAPHNLYSHVHKLYKARGDSSVAELIFEPKELPGGYDGGEEFEVVYGNGYKVSYVYDGEQESYLRFINGRAHGDRESGKQYHARRVIVRTAKHTNVPELGALVDISLDGSGEGYMYEAGRKYVIRWEKKGGKTGYYYQDGTPVETGWGNTWIQVVRSL